MTFRAWLFVACAMLSPATASAQTSNTTGDAKIERLKQQVERISQRIQALADPAKPVSVWAGSAYPGGGPFAGVRFGAGDEQSLGRVSTTAAMSSRITPMVELLWRRHAAGSRLTTMVRAQTLRADDLRFHGIGDSREAEAARFDLTQHLIAASATVAASKFIELTASTGYRGVQSTPAAGLRPLDSRIDYLELSLGGRVDWRPADDRETRGGLFAGSWLHRVAGNDRHPSFSQVEAELVQQVPLPDDRFVLAARVLATTILATDEHGIPFVLLPEVGSGRTLRGLHHGRFRDGSRLVLSAEYRWRVVPSLEAAAFVDYGGTSDALRHLARERFVASGGVGLRFRSSMRTRVRADVATGREGWLVSLGTSQVF